MCPCRRVMVSGTGAARQRTGISRLKDVSDRHTNRARYPHMRSTINKSFALTSSPGWGASQIHRNTKSPSLTGLRFIQTLDLHSDLCIRWTSPITDPEWRRFQSRGARDLNTSSDPDRVDFNTGYFFNWVDVDAAPTQILTGWIPDTDLTDLSDPNQSDPSDPDPLDVSDPDGVYLDVVVDQLRPLAV